MKTKAMRSIRLFILLAIIILGQKQVYSQHLNYEQELMFREKIEKLMQSYKDANQITSNWVSVDQILLNQLRQSFIHSPKKHIFNDLLPVKIEGSKYLTPNEYVQYAQQNYPEGLDVGLDVLEIKIVGQDGKKGQFLALVKAKKTIRGLYGNIRIHTFSDVLHFYVKGTLIGESIEGVGIEMITDASRHKKIQANRKLAGIYIGASGGYNQNLLYSPEIMSNSNFSNIIKYINNLLYSPGVISNSNWSPQLGTGIMPTFELHLMLSKGFGLAAGVRMGSYNPTLVLENFNRQLTTPFIDSDQDEYYPIFEVSKLEEMSVIETIDIPLSIKLRSGSRSVGLYLDFGVVYSTYRSMHYTLNGTVTRKGYYPAYSVTLENIPEYDFYTNQPFNTNEEITAPPSSLSGLASLGLSISVYRNIMLRLGVSINYGITNISENMPNHLVNFYNTTGSKLDNIFLHSASAEFGLYYRILGK